MSVLRLKECLIIMICHKKVVVLLLNQKVFGFFACIFTLFSLWGLFCIIFPQRDLQMHPRYSSLITLIYWSPSASSAKGLFQSCIHLWLSSELALVQQHFSESELFELDTDFWEDFSSNLSLIHLYIQKTLDYNILLKALCPTDS